MSSTSLGGTPAQTFRWTGSAKKRCAPIVTSNTSSSNSSRALKDTTPAWQPTGRTSKRVREVRYPSIPDFLTRPSSVCAVSFPTEVLEPFTTEPIEDEPIARICYSGNRYTTKVGDTCISIAKTKNVGAGALWAINPELGRRCKRIKAGLDICLPETCKTYEVKSQDTSLSIESENEIWYSGTLIGFNPILNKFCSNLEINDIICVSPPGEDFTPTLIPGMPTAVASGYATASVAPPLDGPIASGTTSGCGLYYMATAQDSCARMCLMGDIDFSFFRWINPSIGELCEEVLVGSYYCLRPTKNWANHVGNGGDDIHVTTARRAKRRTAAPAADPRMTVAARL